MAEPNEDARWLAYIGLAGAVLFIVVVALVVLAPTFAPIFGYEVEDPDSSIVGMLLTFILIAIGAIPASRWLTRRNGDGG